MANELRNQLEEYITSRLRSFASSFAAQHAPHLSEAQVQQAVYVDLLEKPAASYIELLIRAHLPQLQQEAQTSTHGLTTGAAEAAGAAGGGGGANVTVTAARSGSVLSAPLQDSLLAPSPLAALPPLSLPLGAEVAAALGRGHSGVSGLPEVTSSPGLGLLQQQQQQQPNGGGAGAALTPVSGAAVGTLADPLCIVFRHECSALGCRDSQCALCQYNPMRLCERNFAKKYLVGDALRAKCGAHIRVELRRPAQPAPAGSSAAGGTPGSGAPAPLGALLEDDDANNVRLELVLLDGVMFKERGGDGRTLGPDDLRACMKLNNHKDEPLLQAKTGSAGAPASTRRILLKPQRGVATLPELTVTDSSEALLTGRKPPFRLLVSAVSADDPGLALPAYGYAVSEDFVVATRRVKQANKAEIPLLDDHVAKIEHIGRETVKKLSDLRTAATELGIALRLPEGVSASVNSVGQFVALADAAEKDGQLKKVLQMVLKLSKEKWEEAATHASQAVVSDFRRRVWYPPGGTLSMGLLFGCKYGAVLLKEPVSLVHPSGASGGGMMRISPEDDLDPPTLNMLRQLKQQATSSWWMAGHPGWGVFKDTSSAPVAGAVSGQQQQQQQQVLSQAARQVSLGVSEQVDEQQLQIHRRRSSTYSGPAASPPLGTGPVSSGPLTGLTTALLAAGGGGAGAAGLGIAGGAAPAVTGGPASGGAASPLPGLPQLLATGYGSRNGSPSPANTAAAAAAAAALALAAAPTKPGLLQTPGGAALLQQLNLISGARTAGLLPNAGPGGPAAVADAAARPPGSALSNELTALAVANLAGVGLASQQQLQLGLGAQASTQPQPQPHGEQQLLQAAAAGLPGPLGLPGGLSGGQLQALWGRQHQPPQAASAAASKAPVGTRGAVIHAAATAAGGPLSAELLAAATGRGAHGGTGHPRVQGGDQQGMDLTMADGTAAAAGSGATRKRPRSPHPTPSQRPSPSPHPSPSPPPPSSPEREPSAHTATTGGAPTAQLLATITSFPSLTSCLATPHGNGGGNGTRGSLGVAALLPSFSFGPDGRIILAPSQQAWGGAGPEEHPGDDRRNASAAAREGPKGSGWGMREAGRETEALNGGAAAAPAAADQGRERGQVSGRGEDDAAARRGNDPTGPAASGDGRQGGADGLGGGGPPALPRHRRRLQDPTSGVQAGGAENGDAGSGGSSSFVVDLEHNGGSALNRNRVGSESGQGRAWSADLPRQPTLSMGMGLAQGPGPDRSGTGPYAPEATAERMVPALGPSEQVAPAVQDVCYSDLQPTPFGAGLPADLLREIAGETAGNTTPPVETPSTAAVPTAGGGSGGNASEALASVLRVASVLFSGSKEASRLQTRKSLAASGHPEGPRRFGGGAVGADGSGSGGPGDARGPALEQRPADKPQQRRGDEGIGQGASAAANGAGDVGLGPFGAAAATAAAAAIAAGGGTSDGDAGGDTGAGAGDGATAGASAPLAAPLPSLQSLELLAFLSSGLPQGLSLGADLTSQLALLTSPTGGTAVSQGGLPAPWLVGAASLQLQQQQQHPHPQLGGAAHHAGGGVEGASGAAQNASVGAGAGCAKDGAEHGRDPRSLDTIAEEAAGSSGTGGDRRAGGSNAAWSGGGRGNPVANGPGGRYDEQGPQALSQPQQRQRGNGRGAGAPETTGPAGPYSSGGLLSGGLHSSGLDSLLAAVAAAANIEQPRRREAVDREGGGREQESVPLQPHHTQTAASLGQSQPLPPLLVLQQQLRQRELLRQQQQHQYQQQRQDAQHHHHQHHHHHHQHHHHNQNGPHHNMHGARQPLGQAPSQHHHSIDDQRGLHPSPFAGHHLSQHSLLHNPNSQFHPLAPSGLQAALAGSLGGASADAMGALRSVGGLLGFAGGDSSGAGAAGDIGVGPGHPGGGSNAEFPGGGGRSLTGTGRHFANLVGGLDAWGSAAAAAAPAGLAALQQPQGATGGSAGASHHGLPASLLASLGAGKAGGGLGGLFAAGSGSLGGNDGGLSLWASRVSSLPADAAGYPLAPISGLRLAPGGAADLGAPHGAPAGDISGGGEDDWQQQHHR